MAFARAKKEVSDYYLHGFEQLADPTTIYAIIAALTSPGVDAVLLWQVAKGVGPRLGSWDGVIGLLRLSLRA